MITGPEVVARNITTGSLKGHPGMKNTHEEADGITLTEVVMLTKQLH